MASGIITVTPESLRSEAGRLRGFKSEHEGNMRNIDQLVRGLCDQWKGDAQSAFLEKYDEMQPTFQRFNEMLEKFAQLMDDSARDLETADQTRATANRNSQMF